MLWIRNNVNGPLPREADYEGSAEGRANLRCPADMLDRRAILGQGQTASNAAVAM